MRDMYVYADEIMQTLGISRTMAYRIMKQMNEELKKQGYIVIAGRVPRKLLVEKMYGMKEGDD